MPRPRKTIRPVLVHLHIPQDVMSRVYGRLFSELEGRLPHGAQAQLFTKAVTELLDRLDLEEKQDAERRNGNEAEPVAAASD